MLTRAAAHLAWLGMLASPGAGNERLPYAIVDTAQDRCYDARTEIPYPDKGAPYYGQDAQYQGSRPAYRNNGDGTVTDLVTGLTWQRDPGEKKTFRQAVAGAAQCRLGGHDDWRLPTIKELYSLIHFTGTDPDPRRTDPGRLRPFLDAGAFVFRYGDPAKGERLIDAQYATCTKYVATTMGGNDTMFGVNFADGRIKGYPAGPHPARGEKTYCVLYVRGNPDYGRNDFRDNGDGTVTDRATGLMWQQADSGKGMNWQEALAYAGGLALAGHCDWRLPDAKELQSIVDYTRSPDATQSAAIAPVFQATRILNEGGKPDYPCYWTSTTHASARGGESAVYIAFGRALGWMEDPRTRQIALLDVHGAGAQRSDPKDGDPSQFPRGRGPQGDVVRIANFARCVRGGGVTLRAQGPPVEARQPPGAQPVSPWMQREDRDGDGKVSREEFGGPPEHFDHLDRNGDGFLTEDEAPKGPPPRPGLPR
ncbi:MAG TPA: DUF1566 domain-containing protein [Planctomycetota bacterium]|nr:DUF1566 domain-containing protein [Planctomycetota bacterium]HRR80162.1 DUF1566 domain-containing protein [Planctomycetota bacterium]HRT94282.1 DUF1566 domain-containing protein [Planctomycetota bacterium]